MERTAKELGVLCLTLLSSSPLPMPPQLPNEVVRWVSGSMDPGMPFEFLSKANWKPEDALNRIFLQMDQAEIANTTFFKLRGDERKAAKSLATYASQGSQLAQEMLALINAPAGNATVPSR